MSVAASMAIIGPVVGLISGRVPLALLTFIAVKLVKRSAP